MTTTDYLQITDGRLSEAVRRDTPEEVANEIAIAQVCAIEAVAAALDRLAVAIEARA